MAKGSLHVPSLKTVRLWSGSPAQAAARSRTTWETMASTLTRSASKARNDSTRTRSASKARNGLPCLRCGLVCGVGWAPPTNPTWEESALFVNEPPGATTPPRLPRSVKKMECRDVWLGISFTIQTS